MKLTFHGENLADIHKQIIDAAATITLGKHTEGKKAENVMEIRSFADELVKSVEDSELEEFVTPQKPFIVETVKPSSPSIELFQSPGFNRPVTTLSEEVKQERLDGYTVSNGQVWVPVEGRSSAFTGIPIERYQAQKAAKEAGAELDSKGVPYDANIHTATKLKTQSGEWKKKPVRGAKTEAAQPQWQPPVTTQAPPVQIPVTNEPTVAMPFTQFPPAEQAQQTPVIESLAPAIGNAPPMHSYESFKKNLGKITMILANQGKIDRNYLMQLAAHFGVNEIWDIVEPKHEANCRILYNSFIEHGLILGA